MANHYIIASGGTGALSVQSFIHLAAAGCVSADDTYYILLMDKDVKSDAVKDCKDLLEKYQALRGQLTGVETFRLPQITLVAWEFTQAIVEKYMELNPGATAATLNALTLSKLFNPGGTNAEIAQLLHTFYTDEELDVNLENGFYGHPNIGAMVFDYIRDEFLAIPGFMDTLKTDLSSPVPTFLYTFGSVFGGTGASLFPNILDALRTMPNAKERLVIGGTLVMPYFKLPDILPDSEEALHHIKPDSTKFFCQTKEALRYYNSSKVIANTENLLLVGTKELDVTSELFARGGQQHQHFHVVLLAAAAACTRFFNKELPGMPERQYQNMMVDGGNFTPAGELLVWNVVPDALGDGAGAVPGGYPTLCYRELGLTKEYQKLERFFRFSLVIAYSMKPYFHDVSNDDVNQYAVVKATSQQLGAGVQLTNKGTLAEPGEIETYYKTPIKNAAEICEAFIKFYFDVALGGYDWSNYHDRSYTEEAKVDEAGNPVTVKKYSVLDTYADEATITFNHRWTDFVNTNALQNLIQNGVGDGDVSMDELMTFTSMKADDGAARPADVSTFAAGCGVSQTYVEAIQQDLHIGTNWRGKYTGPVDVTLGQIYQACYNRCCKHVDEG